MVKRLPLSMKIAIGAGLAALIAVAGLTILLKTALKPEKLRVLVIQNAQKALSREVRLRAVSISLLKGLTLEGLEVSERPDFKAGTFASVEAFRLQVQWRPLLSKKVVVDSIAIGGLDLRVVREKDGAFNFADLVPEQDAAKKAPASKKTQPAAEPMPVELDVKSASLSGGRLLYHDLAAGQKWQISEVEAAAEDVNPARPFKTKMSLSVVQQGVPEPLSLRASFEGGLDISKPGTVAAEFSSLAAEAMGLKVEAKGSARAAGSDVEAKVDELTLKGQGVDASAKFSATVAGEKAILVLDRLKADLSGFPIEAAGRLKADARDLTLSDLKGRVGEGNLKASLSVKDYAKAPAADLQASLSELDAGKLMAALQKLNPASQAEGKPAPAKPAPAPKGGKSGPPAKAKGKVSVGRMLYAKATVSDMSLAWDLSGITPDLKLLSGWAKLRAGSGSFLQNGEGKRSGLMKALLIPFTILKTIGTLGGTLKILPDFNNILFSEIVGDYAFEKGIMTLKDFHMLSAAANVRTTGTIDLPNQALNLKAIISVAKVAPIGVDIGGTFDDPKPRVRLDKLLTKPVEKLTEPALNILKGLFKKKK